MASLLNHAFEHGNLVGEVILENAHYAANCNHCSRMDRLVHIWHEGDGLVLETGNVASEFLFWRYVGIPSPS